MLERARAQKIWDYRGLELHYVPYILLALGGLFTPERNDRRKNRFFFYLDPRLQSVDDLWNLPRAFKSSIWRIDPGTGDATEIPITQDWLDAPEWFESRIREPASRLGLQ